MFCWGFANSLIFPEASVLTGDTSLSPVKTALKCFPETADVNDDEDEDVRAIATVDTAADPVRSEEKLSCFMI